MGERAGINMFSGLFEINFIGNYIARLLTEIEKKDFIFVKSRIHSIVEGYARWGLIQEREERLLYIVMEKEFARDEFNEIVDWQRNYSAYNYGVGLIALDKDYSFSYSLNNLEKYSYPNKYNYMVKLPDIIKEYCNNNKIMNLEEEGLNNIFDYVVEKLIIEKEKREKDFKTLERKKY